MTSCLDMGDGVVLSLDQYGHLLDSCDWSRDVAKRMAQTDGIELTEAHWAVIEILRAYFAETGIEIPMRVLVSRLAKQGREEWASSRALYRLFPEGPVRQGSRYGGLPIPLSCI